MTEALGTTAVLGLGLIGGSLARDLALRGVVVRGWDADPAALAAAVDGGVVTASGSDAWAAVDGADAVVLAVPVDAAPSLLAELAPRLGAVRLITDVGSTKRAIMSAAEALGVGERFVGGHPLAGDTGSGWAASRTGLFAGATVYLSSTVTTSSAAMDLAGSLWEGVGGRCEAIDAGAHDRLLAWTSHLPQAVSSALAFALAREGIPRTALGPGGRDVTRLAGSPPALWGAIAAANADELAPALASMERELRGLRHALEHGDAAARGWFERGCAAG